jgi:hypothetical protein
LQWLARAGQSGTLLVTRRASNRKVEKSFIFSKGRIISTASTEPQEYLGHFLVGHGHLDETLLAKAIEMQQSNSMLLGKILLTLGAISEEDLDAMLRMKAEETVYDVFTWDDAEFEFQPGRLPEVSMVALDLDVESLLLHGAQRVDEWASARALIPSDQCVPVAIRKLTAEEDDESEQAVLDLVNDDRTVAEIVLQSHRSQFAVSRVLAQKIRDGSLKVVKPRRVAADLPRDAPVDRDRPEGAQQLLRQALQDLRSGDLDATLERLKEARESAAGDDAAVALAAQVEERIRGALEKAGLAQKAVLELAHGTPDSSSSLSAQEGFLLSRIDGRFDVRAICKITPLPPLETLVALWKLLRAGHIRVV